VMRDRFSFQQLYRLTWELETVSIREFISTLNSRTQDMAFEHFDRAQKMAETERSLRSWDTAMTVAEEVMRKRRSGGKLE
jgi:hypothetical protein